MSARARSVPAKKSKIIAKTAVGRSLLKPTPSRSMGYHGTLRYTDTYNFNTGVGGTSLQVLASNGIYDPDITGVGHQPAGFDQIMGIWQEYVVVKSSIKVIYTNADANNVAFLVGISHCDFSSAPADYRSYIENGSTVWTKVAGQQSSKAQLELTQNMREFSTQDIFNEQGYSGSVSANPVDTHYYHLWCVADGNADSGNIYGTVEIVYDVYFRDPALMALS